MTGPDTCETAVSRLYTRNCFHAVLRAILLPCIGLRPFWRWLATRGSRFGWHAIGGESVPQGCPRGYKKAGYFLAGTWKDSERLSPAWPSPPDTRSPPSARGSILPIHPP